MARGESLVRQWNVLKVLQAHRFGIPSDQLAARVGCSKRQVLRDLAVLQETGFPISHETRDFGKRFWKLPADFGREPLILSVTEMLSLYLGQQFLTPLAGTPFGLGLGTALEKIQALLPADALEHFAELKETLLVKMIARPDYTACGKQIGILNQAIAEGKIVSIRYRPADRPEPIAGEDRADVFQRELDRIGASLAGIGNVPTPELIDAAVVRDNGEVLRTLSERERIATVETLPADAAWGRFGVRPVEIP